MFLTVHSILCTNVSNGALYTVSKTQLDEIEKDLFDEDLFDEDLFDTSKADVVLRLASLTHQLGRTLEQQQLDELEDFEDKDPFDTSAYAHITKELEDDLECTVYNISWTNVSNGAVFTLYEYS